MSIVGSNALAGASGQAGGAAAGYQIDRSLRFNSADSARLYRQITTKGNTKTFTFSCWLKKVRTGLIAHNIFSGSTGTDTGAYFCIPDNSANALGTADSLVFKCDNGAGGGSVQTDAIFRDLSAWYHVVLAVDTTQATASDRVKVWVNGVSQTLSQSASPGYPNQNSELSINDVGHAAIAAEANGSSSSVRFLGSFYLAEIHFLDGTAVSDATDFGEYDTNNVWQPIDCKDDLTYGTNGFYLNFSDASSNSALGLDQRPGATQDPTGTTYGTVTGGTVANVFDGVLGSSSELSIRPIGSGVTLDTAVTATSSVRIYGSSENTANTRYEINGTDTSAVPETYPTRGWTTISGLTFPITINSFGIDGGNSGNGARLSAIEIDGTILTGTANDWSVNNITAAGLQWASTTWSNDISIDSGNYYLSGNTGPNGFDGNSATYIDCRLGTGANNTTNIIWEPTGGISGVTKIRVNSNYADDYRINNGTWTSFSSGGSYTQIYSGSAFTLTKLEIRRTTNSGSDYGHRVTAYELNDLEVLDDTAQAANDPGIDSLIDTPTNYTASSGNNGGNYCTWNPIDSTGTNTLANGNLDSSGAKRGNRGTISVTSGKYYYETVMTSSGAGGDFGWSKSDEPCPTTDPGATSYGWSVHTSGVKRHNGSTSSYISGGLAVGDVIQLAIDVDAGKVWFGKNNTWGASGDPAAGTNAAFTNVTGPIAPAHGNGGSSVAFTTNFGQRPFAYTPPTGFLSLCTTNLPDPTIADGSTAFDAVAYSGNGGTQSITGVNFSPDFLWFKRRQSPTRLHMLYDTVRGASGNKVLNSDTTNAEGWDTATYGQLDSADSNGFTVTTGSNTDDNINSNNDSYIAWLWDAGSSTVSNYDGSITSQVRANPSAGFSIVSYTGNQTDGATVGHGLNATPTLLIGKNRDATEGWLALAKDSSDTWLAGQLNTTTQFYDLLTSTSFRARAWDNTPPTSSVFQLGPDGSVYTNVLNNNQNYVVYCFAPVEGYSAFGSYTGNGNANGPFVALSFRPRWIMFKNTTSAAGWYILDTQRDEHNVSNTFLFANTSGAEGNASTSLVDILSNGFKLRGTGDNVNASANVYIYAAFSEHPFSLNGGLAR